MGYHGSDGQKTTLLSRKSASLPLLSTPPLPPESAWRPSHLSNAFLPCAKSGINACPPHCTTPPPFSYQHPIISLLSLRLTTAKYFFLALLTSLSFHFPLLPTLRHYILTPGFYAALYTIFYLVPWVIVWIKKRLVAWERARERKDREKM